MIIGSKNEQGQPSTPEGNVIYREFCPVEVIRQIRYATVMSADMARPNTPSTTVTTIMTNKTGKHFLMTFTMNLLAMGIVIGT